VFQIGDPAAPVWLITDDDEGVALDAFDLEPVLAAAGAIRQVDALRDDSLKLMDASELEELGAVALEFLAENSYN
jgi:hypothetical protein